MSHAVAMDRMYRHQRHVYDLTRKYYLIGRDRLILDLRPAPGARVCEIGCGTARNLIKAARRYPEARFYGIDASDEMLRTARTAIDRAGLGERITLARGYAESFDPATLFGADVAAFDVVFFSYALSMIPDWQAALHHAFELAAADGRVLAVDFGDQARLPGGFRSLLHAWLRKFSVQVRLDLPASFTAAARAHRASPHHQPLYRGYAWLFEARKETA